MSGNLEFPMKVLGIGIIINWSVFWTLPIAKIVIWGDTEDGSNVGLPPSYTVSKPGKLQSPRFFFVSLLAVTLSQGCVCRWGDLYANTWATFSEVRWSIIKPCFLHYTGTGTTYNIWAQWSKRFAWGRRHSPVSEMSPQITIWAMGNVQNTEPSRGSRDVQNMP